MRCIAGAEDPSADAGDAYLDEIGRGAWKPEMRLMIESHHKITAYRGDQQEWVEPIRRADWCDVSFAMLRFGLPRSFVDQVRQAFPLGRFYPGHVYKVIAAIKDHLAFYPNRVDSIEERSS